MEFFKNIGKIEYKGKDSKDNFSFKYYNPDEVINGKKMRDHLKFALSWWHTMGGDGTDMFGCGTTDKTWGQADPAARAKAKVDAAKEIMDKLSIDYYGGKTKIIPLELDQFMLLIENSYNYHEQPNPNDIRRFLDQVLLEEELSKDENDWSERIQNCVKQWMV